MDNINIAIIVAEFYKPITESLLDGAVDVFQKAGLTKENYSIYRVSGAYEVPQLANKLLDEHGLDGILCLGCIIRGETPHFDIVANESARGIMNVSLEHSVPVTNGILTTENKDQAIARTTGDKGNKGSECANTLLEMCKLFDKIDYGE